MPRELIQDGIELVKQCEGLYTSAYRCPAGVWTIGFGHTEGVRPGMTVSEQEAEDLLRRDLADAGAQVERLVRVKLNAFQYAALTSFVFNVGAGSLAASTLLRRLNDGQYDAVPIELAKWVKATNPKTGEKVTLPGLVRRRSLEGELWLKSEGEDPFLASPLMAQEVHCDDANPLVHGHDPQRTAPA